jgi:acetyl-CoA hydrolase
MMYTVFQNSLAELMEGQLLGASAAALTVTSDVLRKIYDNMDFFVPRIVLQPRSPTGGDLLWILP